MLVRIPLLLFFSLSSLFSLENIKIGVLAKRSADITMQKYTATAAYLTKEIKDYTFEIVPLAFEKLKQSVADNEIDFVLTNTAYYVELEHDYGASRIATLKNINSKGIILSSFGGVIFTKKDSGIETLDDLKGKRFGAVDINSFGGWIMAQKELKDHGIIVDDFSEFAFFGTHDKVVLAMKNGIIDAGTVRTDTLERMSNESIIDPEICQILSPKKYSGFPFMVSTELYPEWPFAKLSTTPQKLANDVLIALLQMPFSSKAAQDAHIAGWTIPLDYSKVHTLFEELHLGFYGELKKFTFYNFYEKYKVWFYIVAISFLLIMLVLFYIHRLNRTIKTLNTSLEKKVRERTLSLEKMYTQEKYLKDVLRTIADVNKILVNSFSTQTVIQNSMDRLAKHKHYKFVWIGLIKENQLEVVSQSKEDKNILDQKHYTLKSHHHNFALKHAKSAVELNTTITEELPKEYQFEICGDEYSCSSCWITILPLRSSEQEEVLGTLSVFSEHKDGFVPEEVKMLENLATDIGFALCGIQKNTILEEMELEKISNYEETILAFVNIIEQRDSYTAGHTVRVAEYCRHIAVEMGIDEKDISKLEKAAILHDIGKVVTPDSILLKPGDLTSLEYDLIKQHSFAGYQMLSKIEMYKDLAEIIKYHHVRYDGTGYPETSKDAPDEVPLLSHIIVVADAFDAMTTNRIYKARKSVAEAIAEIKLFSGTQFHPDVVKAAVNSLKDITVIKTMQLPSNAFEERRFSYFFRDSLTDAYNANYLKLILIKKEEETRCFNLIKLKHFSKYNNTHGWSEGDQFLKEFYNMLVERYPDAMIFRYHGYDFILIFKEHTVINKEDILSFDMMKKSDVLIESIHHDLVDGMPTF